MTAGKNRAALPQQTPPNISKSVARAFAVLELFRSCRTPLSAASLRQQLDIPQPSMRALLKNLVELNYLQFNKVDKTYFPTRRVAHLGDWIGTGIVSGIDMSRVIDSIALETGETASLNIINDLNIETVYAKTAAHPLAMRLRPGIGEMLWLTVAGRTLLSLLAEEQRDALLQAMIRQERHPKNRQQILALVPLLDKLRTAGHHVGYDVYLQGIGAVSVGAMFGTQPAVVTVAGAKDRIRAGEKEILAVIRKQLQQFAQS